MWRHAPAASGNSGPADSSIPQCNVQFGEGGAGTFSDGKLTTRSKDPRCHHVLEELVRFGAPEQILYEAHPHIGTDILSGIVKAIRSEIIALGGEVRFDAQAEDFLLSSGALRALIVNGEELPCRAGAALHRAQCPGYDAHAACLRDADGGQGICRRRAGGASPADDRSGAVWPLCGPSPAGRGQLPHGAAAPQADAASTPSACARAALSFPRPARRMAWSSTA